MDPNPRAPTPPPQAEAEGRQSRSRSPTQSQSPPPLGPPQPEWQPHSQSPSPPQQSLPHSPFSSPPLSQPSPSLLHPATPQPEEPADDYFNRISHAPPSQRSRLSTFSISRLPSSTPSENRLPARPTNSRRPSIRIRLSNASLSRAQPSSHGPEHADGPAQHGGRSRSASQSSAASAPVDAISPIRTAGRLAVQPDMSSPARNPRRMIQTSLPRLTEEGSRPTLAELGLVAAPRSQRPSITPSDPAVDDGEHEEKASQETGPSHEGRNRLRRVSRFFWPNFARRGSVDPGSVTSAETRHDDEHHEELVDWLDIIDPEVQTLSTLTNVQNSLFVPDLGTWINRRPTYVLSQPDLQPRRPATAEARPAEAQPAEAQDTEREEPAATESPPDAAAPEQPPMRRTNTITSRLSESHYASLPHGRTLDGWSAADKQELDDRVRHMLHSRRSKFKRMMKGFGQYVRRPLGFFVTLYALLITLFGLAWVLFLIGWIYVGEEQVYAIHIIDSILVALFAIMGDGLAPFRAVDTYHMIFVLRYSRMIKNAGKPPRARLRKSHGQPEVQHVSENGAAERGGPLPTIAESSPRSDQASDINSHGVLGARAMAATGGDQDDGADIHVEDGKPGEDLGGYYPLNAKQVKSLLHHQQKLAKSHSFYKPQETHTHFSFPLNFLVAIVILLDCHSCLQISLGACTWGIDYHVRPFALTTVILCVSITCNLSAGLVITIGDRKTRKKDVMKLLDRQELTEDAIARMEQKKEEEEDRRREAILERMAAA